jgi:hypothetical protein
VRCVRQDKQQTGIGKSGDDQATSMVAPLATPHRYRFDALGTGVESGWHFVELRQLHRHLTM